MRQSRLNQVAANEAADPRWKDLFRIGGIVAIVMNILILVVAVAIIIWPILPGSASTEDIFAKIEGDWLGGFMALDSMLLVTNIVGVLLFLALYVALKQVNESYALIALVISLFAVVLVVPARPVSELFQLSEAHAMATTEAVRSQYLAAGETLLSYFSGTAWALNTFLGGFSLLISSLLMLRSTFFSNSTAYVGIVTNLAVCAFFLPVIGIALLFLSVPGYFIWHIQLARSFFRLAHEAKTATDNRLVQS
jgi:hypothetical protein